MCKLGHHENPRQKDLLSGSVYVCGISWVYANRPKKESERERERKMYISARFKLVHAGVYFVDMLNNAPN